MYICIYDNIKSIDNVSVNIYNLLSVYVPSPTGSISLEDPERCPCDSHVQGGFLQLLHYVSVQPVELTSALDLILLVSHQLASRRKPYTEK